MAKKSKTLKANIGIKMPNYNTTDVSLPQGFVGDGYQRKNFVSPSWNGQFQFGGNLPGTVGNMYDRDGAPSNGKKAKKTKASAQEGTNLYPIEYWRKQGVNTADSLSRGTMYKIPYLDQKKLYNIPIPKNVNPNSFGYLTTPPGGVDPNILAKKRGMMKSPTYDISGNIVSVSNPQGANVGSFEHGGGVSPYYINGNDFKTKGMQSGGELSSIDKLNLIKERNKKRDSVNISLTNQYPKDYNKVNLGMLQYFQNEPEKYKNIMKKKKGGVIKDDMGQYNHPGKITQIDSNRITMQGISYPVLGVSDKGDVQMMHPNGEYAFDGTQVTEYPLNEITKGSKQDKGQLKKLRQLTDFSNNNNMEQGKSGIHIKPSHKGLLHKNLGVPEGKKISASKLSIKSTDSASVKKRKQFAINAKKWNHENGGLIPYQDGGIMPLDEYNQVSTNPNLPNYNISSSTISQQPNKYTNAYNKVGGYANSIGQGLGAIGQGLQNGNMENGPSPAQQAVGKFGPWGAVISMASQIGTGITNKSNNAAVGTLGTALFDPGSIWTNKDLSSSDRVIGGLMPLYGGYKAFQARQNKKKQAEQLNTIVQKASKSIDVDANKPKRYVRPEDVAIQPNQMFPQQGVGTNYLSGKNGISVMGEIQNTYAPNTIYTNSGYEPLDDSSKVKDFRTGGNLRVNSHYALGGELQVHKGGYAENISSNPYLPDGGETVMFRGKSHENGGIPISYGKNPVEVEGGEPAVKLQDGGTGEDNLVVFGNMKIPNYGVQEIGDKNAKNKKFKNYIADLSKIEARQNKTVEKGLKLVDETNDNNAFDLLKMNSGKLLMKGGDMKLKEIAEKKKIAANVQNAILDTAQEYNLDSDSLAKGKIKKAKYGAKMSSYQNGGMEASIFGNYSPKISKVIPASDSTTFLNTGYNWMPDNSNVLGNEKTINPEIPVGSPDFNESFAKARKQGLKEFNFKGKKYTTDLAQPYKKTDYVGIQSSGEVKPPLHGDYTATGEVGLKPSHGDVNSHTEDPKTGKSKFNWMNLAGQVWPYFRPTNQMSLDPNQLTGEYYALSHNTLEPVQAQRYNPLLDQPYDISLQDQMNANQSDFNSIQRLAGNNPAALSVLAGQKYGANSSVLGEQFRLNQANKANIYSKNRDILNDAQLKNLAILDQQYVRQSQAKSNTKAIAQSALSSIADKIQQNKLENRTLGVYENLYNYRYDNQGRAINMNSPIDFQQMVANASPQQLEEFKSALSKKKEVSKETHRNGAIVKAIKNM